MRTTDLDCVENGSAKTERRREYIVDGELNREIEFEFPDTGRFLEGVMVEVRKN